MERDARWSDSVAVSTAKVNLLLVLSGYPVPDFSLL